jgi:uncharacterized repeat protein (TIGR01451 family)
MKRPLIALVVCAVAGLFLTRDIKTRAQALPVPTFYKYEIVAKSGAGGLNGFGDNPSINDAGRVAFVGQIAGGEGVFVGDASAAATNITPGFLRTYGRAVQINNNNQVVARDRVNGSPPPTFVRIWNANATDAFTTIARGGGGILDDYDSVLTHPSINNAGQVVFSALDGASTIMATEDTVFGFNELSVLVPGAGLRPMMADDGSTLVRPGGVTNGATFVNLFQFNYDLSDSITIAGNANFSTVGQSSGVSDDGRIVGFFGNLTNISNTTPSLGPGIFASVCQTVNCLGGGARYLQQIASLQGNGNGALDLPWEIWVDDGDGVIEAGEDQPQFVSLEADSRVGVNATQGPQRGVTVAFIGTERRQNRRGLYTSRLNFFGDGVNAFDAQNPGFMTTGAPALVVQEGQPITDWKTNAQLNGNVQTFAIFDPLNNRDRGDLVFWVQMDSGEQAIVRARPQTILHIEFDPLANPAPQVQLVANGLFANMGIAPGWATNFATFLASAGRGFVANTVQNNIVNQVQLAFDQLQLAANLGDPAADISVLVLGRTTDNVPLDGPMLRVLVGDSPFGAATCNNNYNPSCGTTGIAPIDIFNQGLDDFAWDKNGNGTIDANEFGDQDGNGVQDIGEHPKVVLVLVDNIFRIGDYNGPGNAIDGNPEGNFLNSVGGLVPLSQAAGDSPITQADMEHAIAGTIAHEAGHALGLRHVDNTRNDLLMNQVIDQDELRVAPASHPGGRQVFGNGAVARQDGAAPLADTENSGARLAFALGSDETAATLTRAAPSATVLAEHTRVGYRLPALLAPGSLNVAQALVGLVRAGSPDAMPEILPLGGGDLATLLDIDLPVRPGDKVFVMGSTTGTGIDVFTVDAAAVPAVATIALDSVLMALTDSRVRFDVFDGAGQPVPVPPIELFQVVNGVPVDIGGSGGGPLAQANLAVALNDAPDPVLAGQQVTFTMNVTNAGPDAASNVVATLTLPAELTLSTAPGCALGAPVTCNIGALAAGAGQSFTITATASQAGSVSTSASVTGTESDPDSSDNADSENTLINAADTAGPRVVTSAPSGTVAGPIDRFTLTFDEAIDAATFTVADVVSLTGPGGALAVGGVTALNATQFDVTFASQSGAGTYTLVVGPDIRDAANNPMDQNQNATNGEVPGDRFTASVIVEPPDTAGPRVLTATPSGTVPGPIDRFTLTFNEAIDASTFTVADVVSLAGPGGALAVSGVTPLSETAFDVTFASQAGAGTYTLVIGPDVRDLADNPMNQNQNGTNGEVPEDRFTASVIVEPPDTAGPRVLTATPAGTVPGPIDRFTLTFNEAINAASFTVADVVSLTGPGGMLAVSAVTPLTATSFDVTFASQAGAGTYTLVIGPDIRDLANNQMNQNQNGTNGEVPGDRFAASVIVNPPDTAGPRVLAATPSGTVPGPIDRFTVTFNEAINAGTFTVADVVSLTGPGGALPVSAVTPVNASTFDVTFAAQAAGGTYTLVIGPDIRDLADNQMNQNQNGTNGEVPGDRFTAAVLVEPLDTAGPQVLTAAPSGTVAGPIDRFTVTFNEAIDAATFTVADVVSLTGPGGPLVVSSVTPLTAASFDVTFAAQAAGGTYTLVIGPDIRDLADNQMNQNQNGTNGEVPGDRFTASVIVQPPLLRCDADTDGDVDAADLTLIRAALGQPASGPNDARDGNADGLINVADMRYCQLRFTN